jgi:hypothetical protein
MPVSAPHNSDRRAGLIICRSTTWALVNTPTPDSLLQLWNAMARCYRAQRQRAQHPELATLRHRAAEAERIQRVSGRSRNLECGSGRSMRLTCGLSCVGARGSPGDGACNRGAAARRPTAHCRHVQQHTVSMHPRHNLVSGLFVVTTSGSAELLPAYGT